LIVIGNWIESKVRSGSKENKNLIGFDSNWCRMKRDEFRGRIR